MAMLLTNKMRALDAQVLRTKYPFEILWISIIAVKVWMQTHLFFYQTVDIKKIMFVQVKERKNLKKFGLSTGPL